MTEGQLVTFWENGKKHIGTLIFANDKYADILLPNGNIVQVNISQIEKKV
jgi:hypothetical protein